jgi:UDP-N-acetylglucosamine:LPS N-acetylglucosamine transferase
MTKLLFSWELGGGQGHLVPHRELLQQLLMRGHSVHVVSRDVARASHAFRGLSIEMWQAPLSVQPPDRIIEPTVSLSHVLHNVGYANATDLTARISAWRSLIAAVRPDLMLADYSPTALLAARGTGIRTIAIGTGFCLPPRLQPIPAYAMLHQSASPQQLANDESRLVVRINEALEAFAAPAISNLADVFHSTTAQWLTTLPELDHYPTRGPADYWGLAPERRGVPAQWPPGDRRRIFGYLKPFPHLESLLQLLNQLELPTVIACDGLSAAIREKHASRTLSFAPPNVDLVQMAEECHLAITNANHTTTTRFLLAGKPVLMIPLHLEQELIAHAVQRNQLGVSVRLREPRDVFSQLAELLNTPTYHSASAAFAAKYAGKFENRLEKMVSAFEELVSR